MMSKHGSKQQQQGGCGGCWHLSKKLLIGFVFICQAALLWVFSDMVVCSLRQQDELNFLNNMPYDGHHLKTEQKNMIEHQPDYKGSKWCPSEEDQALCYHSHLCYTCRRRYLILMATARSGSTTLMYMLGQLPGIRMGGENKGTVNLMQGLMSTVQRSLNYYGSTYAWRHNPIQNGSLACVAQDMISAINPPCELNLNNDADTIVAFKTVRFAESHAQMTVDGYNMESKFQKLVQFTKEQFPCARFVLNIRQNIHRQVVSRKEVQTVENEEKERRIQEIENDFMKKAAELLGDQAILMNMDEWSHNVSKVNEVIQWLGFPPSCHYQQLLEMNTKSLGANSTRRNQYQANLPPTCTTVDGRKATTVQMGCIQYDD